MTPLPNRIASFFLGLPFGLFMTVVGGGELFTGNTAVVTAAVIEGKASTGGLLKNWVFSYMGNFVGCVQSLECATAALVIGVCTSIILSLCFTVVQYACEEGILFSLYGGLAAPLLIQQQQQPRSCT